MRSLDALPAVVSEAVYRAFGLPSPAAVEHAVSGIVGEVAKLHESDLAGGERSAEDSLASRLGEGVRDLPAAATGAVIQVIAQDRHAHAGARRRLEAAVREAVRTPDSGERRDLVHGLLAAERARITAVRQTRQERVWREFIGLVPKFSDIERGHA